jgi:hypothetical protein
MTEKEELAALRQEIENWKMIATEQDRRLDEISKWQAHVWTISRKYWDKIPPDPRELVSKRMPALYEELANADDKLSMRIFDVDDKIIALQRIVTPEKFERKPPNLTVVVADDVYRDGYHLTVAAPE